MPNNKTVKCSTCGQQIKTTFGSTGLNAAPVVCRRCFGSQTYDASSHWSTNALAPGQIATDG